MGDPDTMQLIAVGVAAMALAAVVYIVASPYLSGQMQTDKRIQGVTETKVNRTQRRVKEEEVSNRRKQVSETLKDASSVRRTACSRASSSSRWVARSAYVAPEAPPVPSGFSSIVSPPAPAGSKATIASSSLSRCD